MRLNVILFMALSFVAVPAEAQIPATVLAEMEYLIGEWETEGTFEGQPSKGNYSARWSADKNCLTLGFRTNTASGTGVSGWDPATKELVETWYRADGVRVEIRYGEFTPTVWKGKVTVTDPAGKSVSGTAQLEKTKDGFTASGQAGDKKVSSQNRRLKPADGKAIAQAWFESLVGKWDYEWQGLKIKGQNEYRFVAGKESLIAEGTSNDGPDFELLGWRPDLQRMVFAGFGPKGNCWYAEYAEISKEQIRGQMTGVLPDGRKSSGTILLKRVGPDRFEAEFQGMAEGEPLSDKAVFTRRK